MNTETLDGVVTEQPELVQENAYGKRKRVMSDKQLKALEEGRKKRWVSKQQVKEEQPTSASEEEDESTETNTSESEESKTETETEVSSSETEPSTADESGETSTSSNPSYKSTLTESSEEEEETDSDDTEPPSPPVLKRQKAMLNERKNERATAKMLKYIQAKTQPFFSHMYV